MNCGCSRRSGTAKSVGTKGCILFSLQLLESLTYRSVESIRIFIAPVAQTKELTKQHTHFTHLPVVDIGGLYSADEGERAEAARELGDAARASGFCYIAGHRVPSAIIQQVLEQSKRFFSLPIEEKMKVYI